ncbi:hypothetical protein PENTCL1PPCAC_28060 [Pristionchus entomophagus]|uniref:Uncharacterized protein n=1 Tax=Pristionchus entomophagus TaxID=358040 RepID=A0AAV5UHG1_9BILA|nr:hypothetical protein PENTCL1PPCAC_28060 [Pristionchus entomophagus]
MLSTGRLLFPLLVIVVSVHSQTFSTGDNSSIADCSHGCSHKDESRFCLDGNAHFYERLLMGHLRYYIATQVSIDLWHKHHKEGVRRNASELHEDVREGLGLQWTGEKDIVTEKIIDTLADIVTERTEEINLRNRTHAPPTHCPIPCEYTHDLYKIVLGLSIALNVILATGLVIVFTRSAERNNRRLLATDDH